MTTPWRDALNKLKSLGYEITLFEGKLRYIYRGEYKPPEKEITPLIGILKDNKEKIINDPGFLIDQTIKRINEIYVPGTLEWLKKYHHGAWEKIQDFHEEINELALKGEVDKLREALTKYEEFINSMVNYFGKKG